MNPELVCIALSDDQPRETFEKIKAAGHINVLVAITDPENYVRCKTWCEELGLVCYPYVYPANPTEPQLPVPRGWGSHHITELGKPVP